MCDYNLHYVNSRSANVGPTKASDLFFHTPTREPSSSSEIPPWSAAVVTSHEAFNCIKMKKPMRLIRKRKRRFKLAKGFALDIPSACGAIEHIP